MASGKPGFDVTAGFAANGFGAHSPGNYGMGAAFLAEVLLTDVFLVIILGATSSRAPKGLALFAIGLGLTLVHLIGIPVTNLSVNPARSTGPALFVGDWALAQPWLFWLAPVLGAVVFSAAYRVLFEDESSEPRKTLVLPLTTADAVLSVAPARPTSTDR